MPTASSFALACSVVFDVSTQRGFPLTAVPGYLVAALWDFDGVGQFLLTLLVLFGCAFLTLHLMRISQSLMPWSSNSSPTSAALGSDAVTEPAN